MANPAYTYPWPRKTIFCIRYAAIPANNIMITATANAIAIKPFWVRLRYTVLVVFVLKD